VARTTNREPSDTKRFAIRGFPTTAKGVQTMQIYLDTANLGELREAANWGILSGVTINPALMAKERGVDFKTTIQAIAELVDGPISAETVSLNADGMVREGREYAQWHPNVIVTEQ